MSHSNVPLTFKTTSPQAESDPYRTLKQIWMHRAMVRLNGQRLLIGENAYSHHLLPAAFGLPPEQEFCRSTATAHLQAGLQRWESTPVDLAIDTPLERNLRYVMELLQLTKEEIALLRFVILLKQDSLLEAACEYIGKVKPSEIAQTLSRLLDIPESVTTTLLGHKNKLRESGLLGINKHACAEYLNSRLLLSGGFSARMMESDNTGMRVFSGCFRPAAVSRLEQEALAHLDTDRLAPHHLKATLSSRTQGVNILIHGLPGTGKTQYARWVCGNIGASAFEVSMQDEDGLPLPGEGRLNAYQIAQSCLSGHPRAVLIFDEIEDVFISHDPDKEKAPSIKGWMTQLLEENGVPAIWISNKVWQIDPALIRRFDLVIEAKVPTQAVRAKMLKDATQGLEIPPSWAKLAAQHAHLTPGIIERTARVVRGMAQQLTPERHARAIEGALNSVLAAQGHRPLAITYAIAPVEFHLQATNADQNLDEIVGNLEQCHSARICLYGPPGTGKSAFGRYVADKLGRPLHIKRASDLISPFLGMTEQAFAKMFQEARDDKAVLLLDEADTFLLDRTTAIRSWEISEVNEMLTQIEAFDGLFIATTNLIERLDPAAMRRFDMKIYFNYLEPHQAALLLRETVTRLGIPYDTDDNSINAISRYTLTPGDFAVAARQSIFKKLTSLDDFLQVLVQETLLRQGSNGRRIGFV